MGFRSCSSSWKHHLNNRVFLSRNCRLIVALRKYWCEASRANMLVFPRDKFRDTRFLSWKSNVKFDKENRQRPLIQKRPKLTIRGIAEWFMSRIEWDVTALSARCYVTHWAVQNLSALQGGIEWNLKQRRIKSRNEINKMLLFWIKLRKYTHFVLGGFQVFVAAFSRPVAK